MIRTMSRVLVLAALAAGPLASPAQTPPDGIEPEADRVLREMSAYLDTMQRFSVHVEESTEAVLRTGQKLQFEATVDGLVRRPDRLRTTQVGNGHHLELYYDGAHTTLHDVGQKYYATIDSPPTVEAALEDALRRFGLTAPVAEFAYRDVYRYLTEDVFYGIYVGLGNVRGVAAHHLAFRGPEVDWQIWVENSDTPVPRKFIITSKWLSGAPQFTAVFTRWDASASTPDDAFRFTAPSDASAVPFVSAPAAAESDE